MPSFPKRGDLPVERWSLVQNAEWTPIERRARPEKNSVTRSRRPGEFTEPIHEATVAGLVVVLLGFYFYEADDLKRSSRIPDADSASSLASLSPAPPDRPRRRPRERTKLVHRAKSPPPPQDAFHERLILVHLPLRDKRHRRPRSMTEPVESRADDLMLRRLNLSEHDHDHLHTHGHAHSHLPLAADDPDHVHP